KPPLADEHDSPAIDLDSTKCAIRRHRPEVAGPYPPKSRSAAGVKGERSESPKAIRPPRPKTLYAQAARRLDHRESGSVVAKVVDATGQVPNQAKQDVHRCRLNVPPRLPARNRIRAEVQQPGQISLFQIEPLADRANLISGEQPVFLSIDCDRVLMK